MRAKVSTGKELNIETGNLEVIPGEQWHQLNAQYIIKAKEHYKTCKFPKYNFWSRFYPEEARKVGG